MQLANPPRKAMLRRWMRKLAALSSLKCTPHSIYPARSDPPTPTLLHIRSNPPLHLRSDLHTPLHTTHHLVHHSHNLFHTPLAHSAHPRHRREGLGIKTDSPDCRLTEGQSKDVNRIRNAIGRTREEMDVVSSSWGRETWNLFETVVYRVLSLTQRFKDLKTQYFSNIKSSWGRESWNLFETGIWGS